MPEDCKNMRMVIDTYWNKVVIGKEYPYEGKVLPEYELKNSTSYPNRGGWDSVERWRRAIQRQKGFVCFDKDGKAKIDMGKYRDLNMYQLVYLEKESSKKPVNY